MRKTFVLVALCGAVFVCAVAVRVLVPYYQREVDQPMKDASRHEAEVLIDAIYQFSEENSEKRFPTNLSEIAPIVLSTDNKTNLGADFATVCKKFIYVRPTPHRFDSVMPGKAVLIEKLGHYKNEQGGFISTTGGDTRFFYIEGYENMLKKSGLSIEQIKERQ